MISKDLHRTRWSTPARKNVCLLALSAAVMLTSLAGARPAVDPPIDPNLARSHWRHIGIKAMVDAPCPAPPFPWATRHLFGMNSFDWFSVPAKLRPFCLYEYLDPGSVRPSAAALLAGIGLSRVEADVMALTLQGLGLADTLSGDLESRFLDQAGAVDHLPVGTGHATRLALLDTSPDPGMNPANEPETSPHGLNLGRLAGALLCDPQGTCLGEITPRLALAYRTFDPWSRDLSARDPVHGGSLGLVGELAEAIYDEIRAWQAENLDRPLVLNLSIAWDGALFGGLEADVNQMPPAVQAVYQALEQAACQGALVIAAAGNGDGLKDLVPGPLLPAAWETRPRSCLVSGSAYQPLVFAAAGIDGEGGALADARPASWSPLVAYADHAVSNGANNQPSTTLTGSSVAAIVVSATAAALWHHDSDASGPRIMDLMHAAGDSLPETPNFACLSASGGCQQPPDARLEVSRVSLCATLATGCDSKLCKQLSCLPWNPGVTRTPRIDGTGTRPEISALDLTEQAPFLEVCSGMAPYYDPLPGEPEDPCPQFQYQGAMSSPWLHPQPSLDPCPNCLYQSRRQELSIEIDDDYQGSLTSPTLVACDNSYSFDVGDTALSAGDSVRIEDLDLGNCSRAVLSFSKVGGGSVRSALLISD